MSLFGQNDDKNLAKYQQLLQLMQQQQPAMGSPFSPFGFGGLVGGLGSLVQGIQAPYQAPAKAEKAIKLEEQFIVSAVAGWRRWTVPMFGDDRLRSNNGTIWEPYAKLEAKCAANLCGGVTCGCGIYAYKKRKQLEGGPNASRSPHELFGEVWLWGRILECKDGFRAQFAYPKSFVRNSGMADKLAEVYGVKAVE